MTRLNYERDKAALLDKFHRDINRMMEQFFINMRAIDKDDEGNLTLFFSFDIGRSMMHDAFQREIDGIGPIAPIPTPLEQIPKIS